jgi:hypothetical protein
MLATPMLRPALAGACHRIEALGAKVEAWLPKSIPPGL